VKGNHADFLVAVLLNRYSISPLMEMIGRGQTRFRSSKCHYPSEAGLVQWPRSSLAALSNHQIDKNDLHFVEVDD